MPVSPRDFELYSRMTGTPMPSDPMSRMQMAPAVYDFTKNFAKKPNLLEKTGNLVKTVGKIGAYGLGLGMQQSLANEQRAMEEQLRTQAEARQAEALVTGDSNVERQKTPAEIIEDKRMARLERTSQLKQQERDDKQEKAMAILKAKKADLVDTPEIKEVQQTTTTADTYGQDFVPNQTSSSIVDRKMEQGSQIADSTPNIAEVLSESQDSMPASMFRPTQIPTTGALHAATPIVGEGLSKSGNEINVIKGEEEEVVGSGATSDKVQDFLKKMGGTDEGSKLDVALIAAMQDRNKKERFYLGANSGDPALGDSPLLDHPDVVGGEDDNSLPGGTNTSSTQDLSSFHKEMRKMDAMERNKEAIDEIVGKIPSPSEKQVGRSPNELAGKDQETFEALMNRNAQLSSDSEAARSRVEQKTAAQQRKLGIKSGLTDQYYPANVARTDIQVGGMVDRKTGLGKSVGISYTPMNGDTKVGFNIMSDPTKPTEVSTFDFVAPPETIQSMESRDEDDLGTKSFGKLFNIARQRKQGFQGV